MQKVCFRGWLRILAAFPLNLVWPAEALLPAGRAYVWRGLTVTLFLTLSYFFRLSFLLVVWYFDDDGEIVANKLSALTC